MLYSKNIVEIFYFDWDILPVVIVVGASVVVGVVNEVSETSPKYTNHYGLAKNSKNNFKYG